MGEQPVGGAIIPYSAFTPASLAVKNPLAIQETWVQSLYRDDPLEKEMATHSSILAWGISQTEEPGGPWGHQESDLTEQLNTHMQPLLVKFTVCCESGTSLQPLSFSILCAGSVLRQPLSNQ